MNAQARPPAEVHSRCRPRQHPAAGTQLHAEHIPSFCYTSLMLHPGGSLGRTEKHYKDTDAQGDGAGLPTALPPAKSPFLSDLDIDVPPIPLHHVLEHRVPAGKAWKVHDF